MDDKLKYKEQNGCSGICCEGCGAMDAPLNTFDWLADVPGNAEDTDIVEVQFKNTRKGYFRNSNKLPLAKGDIVAVDKATGEKIFIEVKGDTRIGETGNVLLEDEVYYR